MKPACLQTNSPADNLRAYVIQRQGALGQIVISKVRRTSEGSILAGQTLGGSLHPTRKFACSFESTNTVLPIVESDLTVANSV
jgi:hypothetical protein